MLHTEPSRREGTGAGDLRPRHADLLAAATQYLAQCVRGARLAEIPGMGHALPPAVHGSLARAAIVGECSPPSRLPPGYRSAGESHCADRWLCIRDDSEWLDPYAHF